MRKMIRTAVCSILCVLLIFSSNIPVIANGDIGNVTVEEEMDLGSYLSIARDVESEYERLSEEVRLSEEKEYALSEDEVGLIALVTMAEAEGESEEGKRLVIDTILNRMDSEHYPDTVSEVIYQPNQFTSVWNGRIDRCEVQDDICQLVYEELENRTNTDVIYFTAGKYSTYGSPLFQVGNHYFSSY